MSDSLKDRSISAFFWVMIDKLGSSLINFLVTIVLARLLMPEDFGLIAMVMIFFELSASFVDSGFSNALVREKEITKEDKSTTFVFNFFISIAAYVILFFAAPAIAAFFEQPDLVLLTRVLGINLIINAFAIIQKAVLTQQIDFKTQTKVRIPSVLISGGVAIGMALNGFGIWSLIAQMILRALIDAILLWYYHPWKLSLRFYRESFVRLFSFGSNILIAGLVQRFFQHVFKLVIGKFFAAATLGFYEQAERLAKIVIHHLFETTQKISYPILAKMQDDRERLRGGYKVFIMLCTLVILPAMMILGVLAKPTIIVLLGEKWIPAIPFLQLLCLAGVTYHFHVINQNILLVMGRSDLGLWIEILEKISISIAIVVGIQAGIWGLVIGQVISAYVNLLITTYYSKKYIGYSFAEQIRDIFPTILITLLLGGVLYVTQFYASISFLSLSIQVALGGLVYLGLHLLFRTEEYKLVKEVILPKTKKLLVRNS